MDRFSKSLVRFLSMLIKPWYFKPNTEPFPNRKSNLNPTLTLNLTLKMRKIVLFFLPVHLGKAFQRGDLQPHNQAEEEEEPDESGNGFPFEFEEMETPEVEYEDEYESKA